MASSSHHVEIEAAKFLQKLIQDSKDEPAKLATKLFVICQHMKLSGKEQSLPYQVISRAMETVINQHGLDIEALKASRFPLAGGPQTGEDSTNARSMEKDAPDNLIPAGANNMPFQGSPIGAWHAGSSSKTKGEVYGGSVQSVGAFRDHKPGLADNEVARHEVINPNKPPVGPSRVGSAGHDFYQGSVSQRSGNLYEHESPSSLDTRSANSQERLDNTKLDKQGRQKENKKATAKRKRAGATSADAHSDNLQQLDTSNTGSKSRKGKITGKGDPQSHFTGKGGEHAHVNPVQSSVPMEHLSSASSGMGPIFRAKQDNQSLFDMSMDKTQISNVKPVTPTSKYLEEGEVSAYGAAGQQKGGFFQARHDNVNPRSVWDQFKVGLPSENPLLSRFAPTGASCGMAAEISVGQSTAPSLGTSKEAGAAGNESKSNIYDSKSSENKVFDISGQISEGTLLNKGGKFWQQRVPYPTQTGDQSFSSEAELGGPGKSPLAVNSNTPQGISAISGGFSKVHGVMPGSFGSYSTIKTGFPAPLQFNSSSFDSHELALKMHKERGMEPSGSQLLEKSKEMMTMDTAMKSPSVEASFTRLAIDSEHRKPELLKDLESNFSEKGSEVQFGSATNGDEASAPLYGGKVVEQDGGTSHKIGNTYKMVQGSGSQGPQSKESLDAGKTPMSHSRASSGMPFKEHHLKQLRAQCLVFLAFRNGLTPRRLHLEIALGDTNSREDGARGEQSEHKGKEISIKEPNSSNEATGVLGRPNDIRERTPPGSSSTGIPMETDSSSKDTDNPKKVKNKKGPPSDRSSAIEERKRLLAARRKPEAEMHIQETADSRVALATSLEPESLMNSGRTLPKTNHEKDDFENGQQQVGRSNQVSSSVPGINQQLKPEMTSLTGTGNHNEASMDALTPSMFHHTSVPQRTDYSLNQPQTLGDSERGNNVFKSESSFVQSNQHADRYPSVFPVKEQIKAISGKDVEHPRDINVLRTHVSHGENHISKSEYIMSTSFGDTSGGHFSSDDQRVSDSQKQCNFDGYPMVSTNGTQKYGNPGMILEKSTEQGEENMPISTEVPPSPPKYSTSEKWIIDHQKRKLLEERNWAIKQRKTEERMAVCFNKLKEAVSSSEDISAKTKSVIELKKLQLLQLQRRLRSDFLSDFFKPITSDMERLKSIKKHRHGRRLKQLEKFEQKMKEERQKRIRERQKEFFSEIEVHKERLDDWFKIKRERWKGFNKYVKEFHKRKERIHREKIDRIQREKINLLKNNDVEGYLRMVQDAKSDRVKQLLKETEKYLQKLGSKVQEAKAIARRFEMEMDENRVLPVVEKNEVTVETEDDSDQAEHYLESNEKYYKMAHSIKESIAEQPTCLQGGKLREYQMNGLRWLVSLYNNHLNGILADEMGLGKTVQVIALICYLMETKNDRGPFLVVVPSSVLSGWVSELSFWAPSINKIAYAGPPEERRKLFKERIVHQKFNVLLTTYEYLMNKHDRPKLSKIHWHYVIIDEGHRIKNASCKLNADLKHYQSSHRLLLTGTPLQNNLEELWALLNFLLPNIFNSSEDFSQWFNKPFESGADTSPDDALLSEEENLLIINRLHQVLRPFVLRRLKHKVENELPEKIERLVRCEASAYQKLLMKRVEDNLGCIGSSRGRAVHNSVMELRNICNHPYLSQLHAEEVDSLIPRHYLPPIVRLCGKLEMLDRLLPKLKATDHRVLFFSTMTRLLDVMEEYLRWKRYRYLRLDGHTTGSDRGALIEEFNRPDSPAFIFLLSIRAGGVGVNLQAADTVIIFDTDWNPQVDLQAQARAHRIGQKRDVLVLRFETVRTVEEQVRAAAEHKLGVANQSITAGFFDNNTSAEDRREYLESLLRECKKEETASVLDDDALNDILARSESEIDTFELIDKQRHEEEMAAWQKLVQGPDKDDPEACPPMPSRLVTDEDLKAFVKAMQAYEEANAGVKRKNELGGLDTQHYGRGKRAREVRSYEDQMTEEEFEKMCQVDSPESPKSKEGTKDSSVADVGVSKVDVVITEQLPTVPPPQPSATPPPLPPPPATATETPPPPPTPIAIATATETETPRPALTSIPTPPVAPTPTPTPTPTPAPTPTATPAVALTPTRTPTTLTPLRPPVPSIPTPTATPPPPTATPLTPRLPVPFTEPLLQASKEPQQPSRRGRGRPKRATTVISSAVALPAPSPTVGTLDMGSQGAAIPISTTAPGSDTYPGSVTVKGVTGTSQQEFSIGTVPCSLTSSSAPSVTMQVKGQGRKTQRGSGTPRNRAKKQTPGSSAIFPETNTISTIPKDRGLASNVSRPSGASNVPTVTGAVGNPLSGVPTAVTMASDSSSASTLSQDKHKLVSGQSGTSAPTIVTYEVNPVSGLHKLVELVPVRLPIPSPVQEKHKIPIPVLEKKEAERVVTRSETKPVIVETTVSDKADCRGSVKSSKDEGLKVSVMHGLQEPKVDRASTPGKSALAQDLIERRNLRIGPMSGKKQKSADKPEPASTQRNSGPGFSASIPEPQNASRGIITAQMEPPVVKPVELVTPQDSVNPSNAPSINSQVNQKPSVQGSSRQTRFSAAKEKARAAPAVKRGPKKKDLARAAPAVKTAAPTARGCLVGPLELESSSNTTEASIARDKQETDTKKLRNISSTKDCLSAPVILSGQPILTDKADFPDESMKQGCPPTVQRNAVASLETNPACTEANQMQAPFQSKEERLRPEVGMSQTPVDTSLASGLTQTSDKSIVASLTKVPLDLIPAESKDKVSVRTGKQEINAPEPRILHSENACDILPDITSTQKPNSMGILDCLAQSKHPSGSPTMHVNPASSLDGNSPCIEAEQVKAELDSKDVGIHCGSKNGDVQVETAMDKASPVGTESDLPEDVKSATLSSLKATSPVPNLPTESHENLSTGKNVTKEPMDSSLVESLAVDAIAPPSELNLKVNVSEAGIVSGSVEDMADSGELIQEKSPPAGASSMQIDAAKGADAFSAITEKVAVIPKESQQSAGENVTKEPMDRDCFESLAAVATAAPPEMNVKVDESEAVIVSGSVENLVDSGQEKSPPAGSSSMQIDAPKDAEAFSAMMEKGAGIPKESQQSAEENVTKEPMDRDRFDSLSVDATAPPSEMNVKADASEAGIVSKSVENLVDAGKLSRETPAGSSSMQIDAPKGAEAVSVMTEKGAGIPKESQQSADATAPPPEMNVEFDASEAGIVSKFVENLVNAGQLSREKSPSAGASSMQINSPEGAEVFSSTTDKGAGIPKESQQSARENVTKQHMDRGRFESLTADTTAPPPEMHAQIDACEAGIDSGSVENLVDSGLFSIEKSPPAGSSSIQIDAPKSAETFSSMSEKGAGIPKGSQLSAVLEICNAQTSSANTSKQDQCEVDSMTLDLHVVKSSEPVDLQAEDRPLTSDIVVGHLSEPCYAGSAQSLCALESEQSVPVVEDPDNPVKQHGDVEERITPSSISSDTALVPSEQVGLHSHKNTESNHDTPILVDVVSECELEEPKQVAAEEVEVAPCEAPDLANLAPNVSVSGQIPQLDEQTSYKSNVPVLVADVTGSVSADVPEEADELKLESSMTLGRHKSPDLPDSGDQIPQLDEQISYKSDIPVLAADAVGSVSSDVLEKADDFMKLEGSRILGRNESPDLPNSGDQVPQSDVENPDPLNIHGTGADSTGSTNPEDPGMTDNSKEQERNTGHNEISEQFDNVVIVSASTQIPLLPDSSITNGSCDDSVGCVIPGQSEAQYLPKPASVLSATVEVPQSDLRIPDSEGCTIRGQSEAPGHSLEDPMNLEKADGSNGEGNIMDPSHTKDPDHPGDNSEDSTDQQKADGSNGGSDIMGSSHTEVPDHSKSMDRTNIIVQEGPMSAENTGERPVNAERSDDSDLLLPYTTTGPVSDQDTSSYDQNFEEPCIRAEDKEILVLEVTPSIVAESCNSGEPISEDKDNSSYDQKFEELCVSAEDKEIPVLEVTPPVVAESFNSGDPIPEGEDTSSYDQKFEEPCVRTEDKETPVLEVISSVVAEPCNSVEPIPVDQGTSCDDQKFEELCVRTDNKETPVLEVTLSSVAAESCNSEEPISVDQCEVQLPTLVENSKGGAGDNRSKESKPSEVELSPQQVLADLSEDVKTAETPDVSNTVKDVPMEDVLESIEVVKEGSAGNVNSSSSAVVEEDILADHSEDLKTAETPNSSIAVKDVPMEDVSESVEVDVKEGSAVNMNSLSTSAVVKDFVADLSEDLKTAETPNVSNDLKDIPMEDILESVEVDGKQGSADNVNSLSTSAAVEKDIVADLSQDLNTAGIPDVSNAVKDVPMEDVLESVDEVDLKEGSADNTAVAKDVADKAPMGCSAPHSSLDDQPE